MKKLNTPKKTFLIRSKLILNLKQAATLITLSLLFCDVALGQIPATINAAGTWSASTGSGSVTFAAGSCYSVTVTEWGGGGGGGGASNNGASGGGAGGGFAQGVVSISGGSICYYSVGTGGTAGTTAGNNGSAGGPTWFNGTSGTNNNTTGSYINAGGGAGGIGITSNAGAAAQPAVGTGTFGTSGVTATVSYSGGTGGGGFVNGSGDGGGGGGGAGAGAGGNGGNGATTIVGGTGLFGCGNGGGGGGGGGGSASGAGNPGNPGNSSGGGGTGGGANGGGGGGSGSTSANASNGGTGGAPGGGGGGGSGCCGCPGGDGGDGAAGTGSTGGGGGGGTGDAGGGVAGNGGARGGGGGGSDASGTPYPGGTGGAGYITITVAIVPLPTPTAGPALAAICAGATSAIMNGSVSAGATGIWTGGAGTWTNATDPVNATYTAGTTESGTITLTLTATNACGTNIASKTITVNPAPSAPTVTSPVNYCQNATATALTATAAGSLLWYTVATGGTGSATAPTPSTTTAGSTTYYVSQTQTGCESPRAAIVVTVNALPTAGATNTGPYCGTSGTITLNGTGGTTYSWSGPNGYTGTGASPTPFSTATYGAGAYNVTVTNANNCTATASTTVIVGNPPAPTVTSPVTYCQNATATALTATAAGSLLWYTVATGGTGSATAPVPSTAASGSTTWYVSQTFAGCESARASIVVTVNPAPVANATNTGPYCGTAGTITVSATGGTSYNWSGPNGYSSTAASPAPFSAATYGAGTYSVTVTDANTCTATTTTIVVINNTSAPTVTSPVTYCQNAMATPLTATATGSLLWYTVATGGTGTATAPIPSTTTGGSTTWYVSQTQNGCESSRASITVTVNPTPVATASNTGPYCTNGTISLTATGGATYNWSGPNGYSGTVASPAPFSAATYGGGPYNVTVTDANNCTVTATTAVMVSNTISLPASKTICNGQSFTFNGHSLSASGVYRDTFSAVSGCDSITVLTLTVLNTSSSAISQTICGGAVYVFKGQSLSTSGTYYDTLTNAAGCDSVVILTLNVDPLPVPGFSVQPPGDSVALGTNIYVTNSSTNASSVQWLLNNQVASLSSGSALPVSDTGQYCIGLIATNAAGCSDSSATQCIRVYNIVTPPPFYYLPNAFTPNGDGINDFLELYSNVQQINYLSITIFDRWGEKVFQSNETGFKWDGTFKEKPAPAGVYTYLLVITFSNGTSVHDKGGISLLR